MNQLLKSPVQELHRMHLMAVERGEPWMKILKLLCEHRWFTDQLQMAARTVVRKYHLPVHLIDDIQQEVILQLANALKRNPVLGFDERQGTYAGYLSSTIYRCCSKSLRQLGPVSQTYSEDWHNDQLHPWQDERETIDSRIDLQQALKTVEQPARTVVRMFYEGLPIPQIAKRLKCSERTVYRRLKQATEQLKESLKFEV